MRSKEYPAIGETVVREQMENGLTIYVNRKAGYNKSTAFFAACYGGADRRFRLGGKWQDTPAGIAHFLEHKMFDLPEGNALPMLHANGASANAFTSSFITAYHFESTGHFEENLRLLLRFVSTPYFTQESVDKEQGIIGQEIRMTEDNPYHALYYGLLKCLYRENPVRDSVAGTVESIAQITPQTLYDCHRVFYNPVNMVLCVTGDQDIRRIADIAREILPAAAGERPVRYYGTENDFRPAETRREQLMEVGLPVFMAGMRTENVSGAAALEAQVAAELALKVLAGPSSPLYARLYGQGLVNQSFGAEYESDAGGSFAVFSGESRDPEAVAQSILAEADRIAREGVDEALFLRLKKAALGEQLYTLDRFRDVCYTMAKGHFRGYDPFEAGTMLAKLRIEDVQRFLSENITGDRLAMSVVRKA